MINSFQFKTLNYANTGSNTGQGYNNNTDDIHRSLEILFMTKSLTLSRTDIQIFGHATKENSLQYHRLRTKTDCPLLV